MSRLGSVEGLCYMGRMLLFFRCYGYSEANRAANDALVHGASATAPHILQAHGDSKESAMLISHFINHVFAANVVACCDSLKNELGQCCERSAVKLQL